MRLLFPLTALVAALWLGSGRAWAAGPGVVVEEVTVGSAAHQAGLRPGDRIHGWSRTVSGEGDVEGAISSELDLLEAATEQGPRGTVELLGERGGRATSWLLPVRRWGLTVRPALAEPVLALYQLGLAAFTAGDPIMASAHWRQAAEAAGEAELAAWLLGRAGSRLRAAGRWDLAEAAFRDATTRAAAAGLSPLTAHLHREWGRELLRRSEWRPAGEHLRQALAFDEGQGKPSLSLAATLFSLSFANSLAGELDAAVAAMERCLKLREELAPESYVVALALGSLGALEHRRARFEPARTLLQRTIALHRRVAPPGPDLAGALVNLGHVEDALGAPEAARATFTEAISILEQTAPKGDSMARARAGLAVLDLARGELARAEAGLFAAMNLWDEMGGEPVNRAKALAALAETARRRGHLALAESYLGQAFELRRSIAPDSPELAVDFANLGALALDRQDFIKAKASFEQALVLQRQLAAESPTVGSLLVSLGRTQLGSGEDPRAAEATIRAGLAHLENTAAQGLLTAGARVSLARLLMRRGEAMEADEELAKAEAVTRRLAPHSWAMAEILHLRGRLAAGKPQGPELLCEAADTLEHQRQRLGGSLEEKSSFELSTERLYFACAEARLVAGEAEDAFEVLERSRARSFLELLARRGSAPSEAEHRALAAQDDRLQAELAAARAAANTAEVEQLERRRRDLKRRRQGLAAPAGGGEPVADRQPLDAAAARATLETGTLLLAYFVGEESTLLFVVEPAGLTAHQLPLGRRQLAERVAEFLAAAGRRPTSHGSATDRHRPLGERLYAELLVPAEAALRRAERLLVSPDGPLHNLPFAALARDGRYLFETKPLHFASSATVYAEFRARRQVAPAHGYELVAFGEPDHDGLPPLPASRDEVEAIGALFERRRLLLGTEASEDNAKTLAGQARLLHFACHGLLDTQSPLDSGLALSASGSEDGDNGLLQAWEIYESMELSAELVTLSACETALGTEMGGEGLLGLTRALHQAGARAVLASLWNVSDRSTARLMKAFYRELAAGRNKDQALRLAQLELLAEGKLAHPYHWAAFQLYGDSR